MADLKPKSAREAAAGAAKKAPPQTDVSEPMGNPNSDSDPDPNSDDDEPLEPPSVAQVDAAESVLSSGNNYRKILQVQKWMV